MTADPRHSNTDCIDLRRIETVLCSHPRVTSATARLDRGSGRNASIIADVTSDTASSGEPADDLARAQISYWARVWDVTYHRDAADRDPRLDTSGWNSIYTGEPFPRDQMRAWVEDSVRLVEAARPERILEIGCGSGMLLQRLARGRSRYLGTDISRRALDQVRQALHHQGPAFDHIELRRRPADDFDGIEPGSFDVVLLNSVVQYFPSAGYLLRVLEQAARALVPGGRIFVQDVRNLATLESLRAAVELRRAADDLPVPELRSRIERAVAEEQELVLHPRFFLAVEAALGDVVGVEICPKHGPIAEELLQHRYQAILHVGSRPPSAAKIAWVDAALMEADARALRRHLTESKPERLGIRGIPNRRLDSARAALDALESGRHRDAGETTRAVGDRVPQPGHHDPDQLLALTQDLPYRADVRMSGADGDQLDVILTRRPATVDPIPFRSPGGPVTAADLVRYSNRPLVAAETRSLIAELRDDCRRRLPEAMVPREFVIQTP